MLRTILSAVSVFALISGATPAVAAPVEAAYLLQFRDTLSDAQRQQLKGLGVRLGAFVQDGAYIARMTNTTRVSRLNYVRDVRPFEARPQIMALSGSSDYLITLVEQNADDQKTVADKVKALGGKVNTISASREHLLAVLDGGQAAQIAKLPAVIAVDPVSAPETDMAISRESSGANHIETAGGYRGQGVRGEVMDGGLRMTHQEFRGPAAVDAHRQLDRHLARHLDLRADLRVRRESRRTAACCPRRRASSPSTTRRPLRAHQAARRPGGPVPGGVPVATAGVTRSPPRTRRSRSRWTGSSSTTTS